MGRLLAWGNPRKPKQSKIHMWDLAFHSKKPRKPQKTKALSDYGESMGPCSLRKVRFFWVFLVSSNGMLGFMCGPWAVSVFVGFRSEMLKFVTWSYLFVQPSSNQDSMGNNTWLERLKGCHVHRTYPYMRRTLGAGRMLYALTRLKGCHIHHTPHYMMCARGAEFINVWQYLLIFVSIY